MILDTHRSFDPGRGGTIAILFTIAVTYISALVNPGASLGWGAWAALLVLGGVHISLYYLYSGHTVWPNRTARVILYCILQLIVCAAIQYIGQGHFWLLLLPLTSTVSFVLARKALAAFLLVILGIFLFPLGLNQVADYVQQAVIFVSALVFVLVFTEVAIHERQARAEKETLAHDLEGANQRLRDYTAQAEELARTRERNRLAREIHDSLGHYLTGVNVQLEAAIALIENRSGREANDALLAVLGKAQTLTRNGLDDVRRSVAALRAGPVGERSLAEAIQSLVNGFQESGLLVRLTIEGSVLPLPPPYEATLYRAIQESLTNTRKHARASAAEIVLSFQPESIRLLIADNGVGFSDAGSFPEGKFGLLGLRERAELLHGKFIVESLPEKGTTIRMELPRPVSPRPGPEQ